MKMILIASLLMVSGCISAKTQECNDYVEAVKAKAYFRVLSCLYQYRNAELSKEGEIRCDAIVKFVNDVGLNSYINQ